jgi:molybdopterin-guanine dinucleotide biosynthesis protein A
MERNDQATESPVPNCGGIVVCGGRSTRMGRSKAHLPWGQGTMLSHIVDQLQRIVQPVIVVSAEGQQLPNLPDSVILANDERSDQGPLEGIRVGLLQLPASVEYAYVTSCDSPLVRVEFIKAMYQQRESFEIVVPRDAKFHHPLAAIYHRGVVARIEQLLDMGKRRPTFLFELANTLEVDAETLRGCDPQLATLQNVNTPEDYQRLRREEGSG